MLNYMKADLYRTFHRSSTYVWVAILFGAIPAAMFGYGFVKNTDAAEISELANAMIQFAFLFFALSVSACVFREEMALKMYKNDTVNGVSHQKIYLAKYLTGVIVLLAFWLLSSLFTVLALGNANGDNPIATGFAEMFGWNAIAQLFINLMCLAAFQFIGIYAKKTAMVVFIAFVGSMFLNNLSAFLLQYMPTVKSLQYIEWVQTTVSFAAAVIGTGILLPLGCKLFEKSEL